MSTVSTVVTSAVVSGVVALGLELVAKPRLEARKERILAAARGRSDFERNLLKLEVLSGTWANFVNPPGVSMGSRQLIAQERRRAFSQIEDITKELVDGLSAYAITYIGVRLPGQSMSAPEIISNYVWTVRGVTVSARSTSDKAKAIHELTEPIRIFLFGGLHLVQRINAWKEIPAVFNKYNSVEITGAAKGTSV
jgi:hypothetical protein